MTQGERLKIIRKELGLTMEKFGEKLGVTKATISRLEKNERNLTDQMTISICREYHVREEWLLNGSGDIFETTPSSTMEQLRQEFQLDDFDYNLVYQYLKSSFEQRDAIREYLERVFAASSLEDIYDDVPDSPEDLEALYPPMSGDNKSLYDQVPDSKDIEKQFSPVNPDDKNIG